MTTTTNDTAITFPAPTAEQAARAATLRGYATAARMAEAESFERCDTDGFASQAAYSLTAQERQAQAEILSHGGYAAFCALFDLEGNFVTSDQRMGQHGWYWLNTAAEGKARFINESTASIESGRYAKNMAKKGYRRGTIIAPAWAKIDAPEGARGFSGMASCFVAVFRTTKGAEGVIVIDNGLEG